MPTLLTRRIAPTSAAPNAELRASPDYAVIGSVIRLDARASTDPAGGSLAYAFTFVSAPIGSKVALDGFAAASDEPGVVSFLPDMAGSYRVRVSVSNASASSDADTTVDVRAILVPHAKGIVPDGKFLWSYLRDAWTQVEGREFFETLWSALIQIVGGELLKLYQVDYNKSIRDIQSLCQKRWLSYEPELSLTRGDFSVFLGNTLAGAGASTGPSGGMGRLILRSANEVSVVRGAARPEMVGRDLQITYSLSDSDVASGPYPIVALTSSRNGFRLSKAFSNPLSNVVASGQSFGFSGGTEAAPGGPTEWTIPGAYLAMDIRVGDAIVVEGGTNAGIYSIISRTSTTVTVDRRPPKYSDGSPCTVHRPLGFSIELDHTAPSNTVVVELEGNEQLASAAPGRVLVVNGQAYTISRTSVEYGQVIPVIVVTVDRHVVVSGLKELPWRLPNTLVSSSVDFEALGVSTGDVLKVLIERSEVSSTINLQVVGVDRNRLGFVLSDEPATFGEVPEVPDSYYTTLSSDLGIGLARATDSGMTFSDLAARVMTELLSKAFQVSYWNQEKSAELSLTLAGVPLHVRPLSIIRNSMVPVDAGVRSVPSLQECIVFPEVVEREGQLYQIRNKTEIEIARRPTALLEGSHYLIDTPTIDAQLTFRTGTSVVAADSADFLDSGVGSGDSFTINSPLDLAGTYTILEVLGQDQIKLDRAIPLHRSGEYVSAKITITRGRSQHYLRFIPGLFSVKKPAPGRFWAEVSFFDNTDAIENNFGILVGLTRADLDRATSAVEYRQAVAGLMYAHTKGSTLGQLRLGAQILLGLPFAEHRGVIRSIDSSFKLDFYTNLPTYGRILVEDVDQDGEALGVFRFYHYPLSSESSLTGPETNPDTGLEYTVGDVVEEFSPLCKGVEVNDYKSQSGGLPSIESLLQKYHAIRIRADSKVLTPKELELVSSFLRRLTPSYVAFHISMLAGVRDEKTVVDRVMLKERTSDAIPPICDNITMGLPFALRLDSKLLSNPTAQFYGTGFFTVRRAGHDLETVSSTVMRVALGGLVSPRVSSEVFEAPLCESTDYLYIPRGQNTGLYDITSITDTDITVSGQNFVADGQQTYAVVRKVEPYLAVGTASYSVGDEVIPMPSAHLRSRGVMPGDVVSFTTSQDTGSRHIITEVSESIPGSGEWDQVRVTPAMRETLANDIYIIYRPAFMVGESPDPYQVMSDGSNTLTSVVGGMFGFVEPGDELVVEGALDELRHVVVDPNNLFITPALPAGVHTVRLRKSDRGASTSISMDMLARFSPDEAVLVSLSGTGAAVGADGTVLFDAVGSARVGDLFAVTSGANATVDVGLGAGVFVVGSIGPLSVNLTTTAMTEDLSATYKLIRRKFSTYAPAPSTIPV